MLTEQQITEWKQEHGELVQITVPATNGAEPLELVFKRAPAAAWAEYQDALTKENINKTHYGAMKKLAHACTVHPEAKQVEECFRRFAALPAKIAREIADISGAGGDFEVKKL